MDFKISLLKRSSFKITLNLKNIIIVLIKFQIQNLSKGI